MNKNIELTYKNKQLKGILINETNSDLSLKLSSGYTVILNKSEISNQKELENKQETNNISINNKSTKQNKDLPKITIFHTGGTIASKVDYQTGAVSSKFTPEELLDLYPEFNSIANITPKMLGNMASDDMRFAHYNKMLENFKKTIQEDKPQGIILAQGTDTIHYTTAALQYAIQNTNIPIIIVGAQRSSDRPSSDAYLNLKNAIEFIIDNSKQQKQYQRVGICMHKDLSDENYLILDGINAKKTHSSRRDTFKQINFKPFCQILNGNIEILRKDLLTNNNEEFDYIPYNTELKIGFFKPHPNTFPEEIKALSIYDAIVIEATGLGHMPINEMDEFTTMHPQNLEELKNLIKQDKKIAIGVQTVSGQTNMNVYSPGRVLNNTGVLGQFMTLSTETLFIRLAHCLSQKNKDFNELWNSNLEGFDIKKTIDIDEK